MGNKSKTGARLDAIDKAIKAIRKELADSSMNWEASVIAVGTLAKVAEVEDEFKAALKDRIGAQDKVSQ